MTILNNEQQATIASFKTEAEKTLSTLKSYLALPEALGLYQLDPSGEWERNETDQDRLLLSSGLLPVFACNVMAEDSDDLMTDILKEYEITSGQPVSYTLTFNMKDDVVLLDDHGTYQFGNPEDEDADPPQYAVMAFHWKEQIFYIYPHAMVSFVLRNSKEVICFTRMD
jgi:hypothetical protein